MVGSRWRRIEPVQPSMSTPDEPLEYPLEAERRTGAILGHEQNAARVQPLDTAREKWLEIASQGPEAAAGGRGRGWIDHDSRHPFVPREGLQITPGIAANRLVPRRIDGVFSTARVRQEIRVQAREIGGGKIDGVHALGTRRQKRNAERPRMSKQIQPAPAPPGEGLESSPILALIDEEPETRPDPPRRSPSGIDPETQSVFQHLESRSIEFDVAFRKRIEPTRNPSHTIEFGVSRAAKVEQLEDAPGFALGCERTLRAKRLDDTSSNRVARTPRHEHAKERPESVDEETGQIVSFTMNQPKGVGSGRTHVGEELPASGERPGDSGLDRSDRSDLSIARCPDSRGQSPFRFGVGPGERATVLRLDANQRARPKPRRGIARRIRKDPRMSLIHRPSRLLGNPKRQRLRPASRFRLGLEPRGFVGPFQHRTPRIPGLDRLQPTSSGEAQTAAFEIAYEWHPSFRQRARERDGVEAGVLAPSSLVFSASRGLYEWSTRIVALDTLETKERQALSAFDDLEVDSAGFLAADSERPARPGGVIDHSDPALERTRRQPGNELRIDIVDFDPSAGWAAYARTIDHATLDPDAGLGDPTTPGRPIELGKEKSQPGAKRPRATRKTKLQAWHDPRLTVGKSRAYRSSWEGNVRDEDAMRT